MIFIEERGISSKLINLKQKIKFQHNRRTATRRMWYLEMGK
jgi:hypothetical protein